MRLVYGVLAAVALASALSVHHLASARGYLSLSLAMSDGPWAKHRFLVGAAGIVALDVWTGYLASRFGD